MQLIYQGCFACCLLLLSACYKDHGNYTYGPSEGITINGIETSYSKISLIDRLTLNPKVISTDTDARLSYWWGIYEPNTIGYVSQVDTISRTLTLDYPVTQHAGDWVLIFGVRNEHTGLSKIITSSLKVNTRFTRGWYVMKDDGVQTDVDLFITPSNITPTSVMENVFSLVNHKKIDGKASLFGFDDAYKSNITGIMASTRACFILSDKDASVVDINTFREIHPLDSLFYEKPAVKKPNSISGNAQSIYLVNDGRLCSIFNFSSNIGLFGATYLWDDNNSPYRLSKYFLVTNFTNPVFFDEISASFVSSGLNDSRLSMMTDKQSSAMPAFRNKKELLFMGVKSSDPFTGIALFRDKANPSLKILSRIMPDGYAMMIQNDTLTTADKLYQADHYGLIVADENLLYFSVGNEVWSRNLNNNVEQLQLTVPAGEHITFIRHRKYFRSEPAEELPFFYNYMLIGTSSGGRYKVRAFRKTSGNLAATPDFTLEGQGNAGDVIYIAPMVHSDTYPNSY